LRFDAFASLKKLFSLCRKSGKGLYGLVVGLGFGCALAGMMLSAWAGEKYEYKDIYLTENRVCKACRLEWLDPVRDKADISRAVGNKSAVKLINRAGQASIVLAKEVLGIDRHPILRKAMLHSLRGVGLPGEVLVPSAFDDGNDFVCKYCDSFHR